MSDSTKPEYEQKGWLPDMVNQDSRVEPWLNLIRDLARGDLEKLNGVDIGTPSINDIVTGMGHSNVNVTAETVESWLSGESIPEKPEEYNALLETLKIGRLYSDYATNSSVRIDIKEIYFRARYPTQEITVASKKTEEFKLPPPQKNLRPTTIKDKASGIIKELRREIKNASPIDRAIPFFRNRFDESPKAVLRHLCMFQRQSLEERLEPLRTEENSDTIDKIYEVHALASGLYKRDREFVR